MNLSKKLAGTALAGAMTLGVAGMAEAGPRQDGLVNVVIARNEVIKDVNLAAAVDAIVQACGLDVDAVVGVLARVTKTDRDGRTRTFCHAETGPVRVRQN